jgi:hypothetical protein
MILRLVLRLRGRVYFYTRGEHTPAPTLPYAPPLYRGIF